MNFGGSAGPSSPRSPLPGATGFLTSASSISLSLLAFVLGTLGLSLCGTFSRPFRCGLGARLLDARLFIRGDRSGLCFLFRLSERGALLCLGRTEG
jgi:hypothetical protein